MTNALMMLLLISQVECFQVIVDGNVQATVKPTSDGKQLRATVQVLRAHYLSMTSFTLKTVSQGYNVSMIHRVSVKTVGTGGRGSIEAACTMVFGKDAPLAPTMVKANKTTSTSSTLSWIPSNSNFMHAICVNNVEVKTVKPGVYRYDFLNLLVGFFILGLDLYFSTQRGSVKIAS